MIAIVPNVLRDAINTKLDVAFAACPEAERDREVLYNRILEYFDEFGTIPDFKIVPKAFATF